MHIHKYVNVCYVLRPRPLNGRRRVRYLEKLWAQRTEIRPSSPRSVSKMLSFFTSERKLCCR